MDIKISVIVLTYKKFSELERNIASIKEQDFTDYEVILQDDCSENFNEQAISNLMMGIQRFTICRNSKNVGTVQNYYNACKIARGKIVVPLSQDDYFADSTILRSIYTYFKANDVNICTSYRVGAITRKRFPNKKDANLLISNDFEILWKRLAVSNFISGAVLYCKRSYILSHTLDSRFRLLEDYPMILNAVESGEKIGFINKATICYGEEGVSSGKVKTSVALVEDFKKNMEINILPYIYRFKSNFGKCYIENIYERYKRRIDRTPIKIRNLGIILASKIMLMFVNADTMQRIWFDIIQKFERRYE